MMEKVEVKINAKATGENIRRLREKKHLSVADMADVLEINIVTVYYWQQGKSVPSLRILLALGKMFDVKVEDILVYDYGLQRKV